MTAPPTEPGTATRAIHVGRQPVYDRLGALGWSTKTFRDIKPEA